jgi:hypothetical protein
MPKCSNCDFRGKPKRHSRREQTGFGIVNAVRPDYSQLNPFLKTLTGEELFLIAIFWEVFQYLKSGHNFRTRNG